VFTGAGSSATIVQRLDDDEARQALRKALSDIKAALSEITETTMVDPNEIVEMTEAASAELDKKKPNAALLGTILSGIATSIQTVAAAQQVYPALKAAAASIGIVLP
jgi:pyruvate/2-oxoglutarate dehydrogenase complex dihydrolipoamide acyltransferase (E2) component